MRDTLLKDLENRGSYFKLVFFGLVVLDSVRIDRNRLDNDVAKRFVVIVDVRGRDFIYDVHSVDNSAESGVLSVEMGSVGMHNEELRSRAVGHHGTSHGNNSPLVLQIVFKTVLGELSSNRIPGTARTVSFRVSALNHKALDNSVKTKSVVKAFLNERNKIVHGVRSDVRIKFDVKNVSVFHFKSYDRIVVHFILPLSIVL